MHFVIILIVLIIEKPFSIESSLEWKKVTIPHSWNTEDILDDECVFNYCQNCGYGTYDNLILVQ